MHTTRHILATGLLALLLLPAVAHAQGEAYGSEGGRELFGGTSITVPGNAKRFEQIDMSGQTLAELLQFFRENDPTFQAVLMTPEEGDLKMPPLQLRNVRAADVLQLLNEEMLNGDAAQVVFKPTMLGDQLVFKVYAQRFQKTAAEVPQVVRVFSLGGPMEEEESRNILTLLDKLAEAVPGDTRPELQVNAETGVVIAKGTNPQLNVFAELFHQWEQQHAREQDEGQRANLEQRLAHSDGQIAELTARYRDLQKRYESKSEDNKRLNDFVSELANENLKLRRQVGDFTQTLETVPSTLPANEQ